MTISSEEYLQQVKHALAKMVYDWINDNKLTQSKASAILGLTQPRLSNICNFRLKVFSVDCLMGVVSRMGYQYGMDMSQASHGIVGITFVKTTEVICAANDQSSNGPAQPVCSV